MSVVGAVISSYPIYCHASTWISIETTPIVDDAN